MMYTVTLSVTFLTIMSRYQQKRLEGRRIYLGSRFHSHSPPLQNGSAAAGVCVRQLSLHPVMEAKTDSPKLFIPEPLETA